MHREEVEEVLLAEATSTSRSSVRPREPTSDTLRSSPAAAAP